MDSPELTAEITARGDDGVVIVLAGEIDAATSGILTDAAHAAAAGGAIQLVLDLSNVSFMDSSGIAALIRTRSIASTTLRRPSIAVQRLLEVTGLATTFEVEA